MKGRKLQIRLSRMVKLVKSRVIGWLMIFRWIRIVLISFLLWMMNMIVIVCIRRFDQNGMVSSRIQRLCLLVGCVVMKQVVGKLIRRQIVVVIILKIVVWIQIFRQVGEKVSVLLNMLCWKSSEIQVLSEKCGMMLLYFLDFRKEQMMMIISGIRLRMIMIRIVGSVSRW